MRTHRGRALVVAAVLLVAVGAAAVYALASGDRGGDGDGLRAFDPAEDGDCARVTGGENRAELRRVVPRARSFSVAASNTLDERFAALRCEVRADGESAVEILLNGANGKEDWEKEMTERSLLWPSGRKPVKYPYAEGYSGSRAAALFLPCPAREATDRGGFRLTVVAQPKDAAHEAELRRLARDTAEYAAERMKCGTASSSSGP